MAQTKTSRAKQEAAKMNACRANLGGSAGATTREDTLNTEKEIQLKYMPADAIKLLQRFALLTQSSRNYTGTIEVLNLPEMWHELETDTMRYLQQYRRQNPQRDFSKVSSQLNPMTDLAN